MTSTNSVLLPGLQPQPLASYLGALGVLRICTMSRKTSIRGAFAPSGFLLNGIAEDELLDLLLDEWAPTPILTPWNNASGFYDSSKGRLAAAAMETILATTAPRFASLRNTITHVRRIVATAGYQEAPEKEGKAAFLSSLRNTLPDDAVAWLDAVAVVDEDDARMMPVLGSGGNEGVLDYSGLFLRSLVETVIGDRARASRLLASALTACPTHDLIEGPGGQFHPGTAGGFNTGPDFESKDLPKNPWTFLLLIEGTLVWASAMASRQCGAASGYRFAVSPFTVRHRAAGYGSASQKEDDPSQVRAEVWVPIWRRPAALGEVAHLIAEGRVELVGRTGEVRRATDSLDFVDAVASLGIDRGVDSFVRYALTKRRGDSYIALPAGAVSALYRREIDLVRQLDAQMDTVDRFLARFPSEQGPPAQLVGLRRAIDDARFDVASRGGSDVMKRLVRTIGALEMSLARRDPAKEPKLRAPLGGLAAEWVESCGDSAEVRLAASLASLARTGGAGPLRAYLAPLDPDNPARYAPGARTIAWAGGDLADRLANVLQRRMLDVRTRASGEVARARNPVWGARRAGLAEIAMYLSGLIDDRALEELLFGFTWVKMNWKSESARMAGAAPPLPRAYCLLKLLFLPDGIPKLHERVPVVPDASIVPLLRTGRVSDAIEIATLQLRAKGFRARRVVEACPTDAAIGRRLASALLIPIGNVHSLLADALIPDFDTHELANQETDHAY